MRTVLLDTGPVVALLRAEDPRHEVGTEAIKRSAASGQLVTTWEVVSEAFTLLRVRFAPANAEGALQVLAWAQTLTILGVEPPDRSRTQAILTRHRDLRLSYVDALVLAVAERRRVDEVLTLDQELAAVRLSSSILVTVLC
jgi:predicted nucleic acid-binding protein